MEPNWKRCDSEEFRDEIKKTFGIRYTLRARIEVTSGFDGMFGKRGFEYLTVDGTWTEIDGIGKFGLKKDEYKYIDDGVY